MSLFNHLNCTVFVNSPKVNTWLSAAIVKNGSTLLVLTFRRRTISMMMTSFSLVLIVTRRSLRKLTKAKKYRNHVLSMVSLVRLRNKLKLCLRNCLNKLLKIANKMLQLMKKSNQKNLILWQRKNFNWQNAPLPLVLIKGWCKRQLQS